MNGNGSIRPRGISWEVRYYGQDETGRRVRKSVYVRGRKRDAQRRLREILSSLDAGASVVTGRLSVAEFMARWLRDYVIPNTRPRTAQRYESDIRLHICPAIGHIQLTQLRAPDIRRLEAALLATGKSPRSVRHVHVVLKEALKHGVRWGVTHINVAEAVDGPKLPQQEVHPPTVDEVRRILELARETPYFDVLTFMARTGVRRGEVLALHWRDIDLERGTASIVASLQRVKREGLVFTPPKSAKSRRAVALDAVTVEMLRGLQGRQILTKAELSHVYHDSGLVFPGAFGDPLDPATLTRNFKKLACKASLGHVRLHDLRHFHATALLQAGVHLVVASRRLGHASVAITADTYSHVAPGLQKEAADAFAKLLGVEWG